MIKFFRRLWYLSTRKHKHDYIKKRIMLCNSSCESYQPPIPALLGSSMAASMQFDRLPCGCVARYCGCQIKVHTNLNLYPISFFVFSSIAVDVSVVDTVRHQLLEHLNKES